MSSLGNACTRMPRLINSIVLLFAVLLIPLAPKPVMAQDALSHRSYITPFPNGDRYRVVAGFTTWQLARAVYADEVTVPVQVLPAFTGHEHRRDLCIVDLVLVPLLLREVWHVSRNIGALYDAIECSEPAWVERLLPAVRSKRDFARTFGLSHNACFYSRKLGTRDAANDPVTEGGAS